MIKDITYNCFQSSIRKSNIPIECQWEITYNCNLNCGYCYVVKQRNKKELRFLEIEKILAEVYTEGCLWLTFTGGEPFFRKDFLEIYSYAHKKGFLLTLFTNGTLLDKKKISFLKDYRPLMIELTLNSITESTYELISMVKGSFKKAMQAIELILENRLPLSIKTMVMNLNKEEIPRMKDFVQNKLKVPYLFDPVIIPKLNGDRSPCKYRIQPEGYKNITHCSSRNEHDLRADAYGCKSGLNTFYLDPYGYLKLCLFVREFRLDLKKDSFKQGFFRNFAEWMRMKSNINSIPSKCRACKMRGLCFICWSRAKLETKEDGSLEFYCQIQETKLF